MTRIVATQQSQSNSLPPGKARKDLRTDTPRSQNRIRVLILEDNESDAELMIRALEQSGMLPEWERVETEPEFTARLTPAPDLILSDYALPQFHGLRALQLVRSRGLDVPFILVSGSVGEDIAVEAVRQGADDYLLKDRMARLGQAVSRAIEKKKLRDQMRRAEDALQDSEERFRATFEQAGVGMALRGIDPRNSRWLRVNQKLCDILGYTKEELLRLTSVDITPPEDRELAIEYNEKLLKGVLTTYSREKRYLRKDGRIVWANITLTAVSGPDGRRSHIISVIEEITERKLQQQKIEKLSRVRAVLGEINSAIVRIREREALLRETCRIAIELGKFKMIWIGMMDRTSMNLRPVAWAGFDDKFMRELRVPIRDDGPGGQGTTPRAARGKQAAWDNDFAANPGLGYVRRYALECGVRSAISLPLVIEGEIEGVFSLYAEETGFFTEDEIRMLEELASNVSLALEHILQQGKIKRLLRTRAVSSGISATLARVRDRQELLQESCRIAAEDGQFPFVWIGLLDPVTLDVTPVAWSGAGSDELTRAKSSARNDTQRGMGAVGHAIRERRAVINYDIAAKQFGGPRIKEILKLGFRSQITLPLFVDETVIGTLTLYAREPNVFDQEELKVLTELASNISFALEDIAKQQKLDKLSRIRAVSSEVNATIVRAREQRALLEETCRIAFEHGSIPMVWIGTINPEKQEVRPVVWTGFSQEAAHAVSWLSIASAKGTFGEAMQTRRAAIRDDIEVQLPVGKLRQEALAHGCLSTICLPLVVEGRVAALAALFAPGRGFFDKDELALLNELAGNISFALEHIARQDRIEKLSRVRAVSSEVNAAIARVRDRETLLRETCRVATEHGKFEFVWVASVDQEKQHIQPVAWAGFAAETARAVQWASLDAPGVTLAEVVRTRRVAVRNDIEAEQPTGILRSEAAKKGCRSTVCLPFVVEGKVVAAMILFAAGADFFVDDELALLNEIAGDISFALQNIEKREKLDYLSYYDPLTGLPNRTLYLERLGQRLDATGAGEQVVVMLGDTRRLRMVNETLGRQAGDEVLRQVAKRLVEVVRNPESLARISADWFATFVPNVRDIGEAARRIEQMRVGFLRNPFPVAGRELTLAFTLGAAVYPGDGKDAESLLANAEAALKKAKATGESLLFYEPSINARVAESLELENKLRPALAKEQFVLHYQPKIELASGRICGLEALIRWNDPETGLVPPVKFIPLLEETGMILDVGRWAMRQALRDYREWTGRGLQPPRIAVNVSPIQLRQKDFVEVVRDAIGSAAAGSHGLDLEITESLIMDDIEGNIGKLRAVRDMGVKIAIDDFGTGYSSLGYLSKLPVHALKIDRSFIITMAKGPDSMTLVSTIISLAHSLNLTVVAEGVDSEDQRKILRLLKCDEMQGYLYSKPLPASEIESLLVSRGQVLPFA